MARFDITIYRHLPEEALLSIYSSSLNAETSGSNQSIATVSTSDMTVSYVINETLNNTQQNKAAAYALVKLNPDKYSQFSYLAQKTRKYLQ